MSGPAEEEQAYHPEQDEAKLLRRMAEVAGLVAATEDKIAATLEQVAVLRPPPDAERLRAKAREARAYAAKERARAARYTMRGGDDDWADEPRREPRPPEAGHAGSAENEPESRREQIRQRLEAIHMRVDELQEKRRGEATPAASSARLGSAQHHTATSQAAAEQATDASVRASRRAAEAHEHAAVRHERAAAAGFGNKDEHERQAAIHRAAAATDTQRAEHAQPPLRDDEADDARGPYADQS